IARNASEGQDFLAKNQQRPGVETLPSGLQYEVLAAATDGASPGPDDVVRVHYRGTRLDGGFVESSLARGNAVSMPMGKMLPGWREALTHMKEGEKWRVFLPPE